MVKIKSGQQKTSKRRSRKTVDKWKSKVWYEVNASPEFENIYIGQTPASDENMLYNRVIENSLYDFTQDFNHAHIKLRFKIKEVNGSLCTTQFIGHEMTRDFIRSLIRRGANRIDGIIDTKTKDGFTFRITGAVFTRNMAKSSQQKTIRKIMYDIIAEQAKNLPFQEFVREIVFGSIEKDIRRISNEIYPIRDCKLIKSRLVASPVMDEE
ncbi:MAG: 30S ribosomal protein S3ae [Candidatus Hodarchaeota archaeon]